MANEYDDLDFSNIAFGDEDEDQEELEQDEVDSDEWEEDVASDLDDQDNDSEDDEWEDDSDEDSDEWDETDDDSDEDSDEWDEDSGEDEDDSEYGIEYGEESDEEWEDDTDSETDEDSDEWDEDSGEDDLEDEEWEDDTEVQDKVVGYSDDNPEDKWENDSDEDGDDYEEDEDTEYTNEDDSESEEEDEEYSNGELEDATGDEEDEELTDSDLASQIKAQVEENEEVGLDLSLTSEEDVLASLSTIDCFEIEHQDVKLEDLIGIPFFKDGREETISGLTENVRSLKRILKPLDVVEIVWNNESREEDGYSEFKYLVVDGYRRLYASIRNQDLFETIPCSVWKFKNEQLAKEIIPLLGIILNRNQEHYPQELWGIYNSLELSYGVTPENFEHLMQLNHGDASKMRDIMTSSYDEPRDNYITKEKTLDQAYSLLSKLKKEENQLLRDDQEALMGISESGKDLTESGTVAPMTDQEARAILEMDNSDMALTSDMFGEVNSDYNEEEGGIENYSHVQDVKNRERVNPELKKAVFKRDKLTCQCCEDGGLLRLPVLVFHHKIPVHAGGADSMDNGVTLCCNCHLLLHFFERHERFEGKLDDLPQKEIETYTKIMQMAQIAITAGKQKFKDPKERKRQALNGISYPMPGEDMDLKREVFAEMG